MCLVTKLMKLLHFKIYQQLINYFKIKYSAFLLVFLTTLLQTSKIIPLQNSNLSSEYASLALAEQASLWIRLAFQACHHFIYIESIVIPLFIASFSPLSL